MKISACVIAKDEEKNLPRLLKSLKGKFDEVILVDTGSKDKTVEIAKSYGCKVFLHKWNGFADARNRAVKEATGDWLWHFDADFELEEEEFRKALLFLKGAPPFIDGFFIGVKNLDFKGDVRTVSSHIFIHRKGIKWKGKVHESPTVKRAASLPVFVNHYGYSDPQLLLKKAKRNLELLKEELSSLKEGSKDYNYKLFYLLQTYNLLSFKEPPFIDKALKLAKEFLEKTKGNLEDYGFYTVFAYNYYLSLLFRREDFKGMERVLEEVKKLGLELPEFYFYSYKLKRTEGKGGEALKELLSCALLLDKMLSNPFVVPYGGVSECYSLFESEVVKGEPLKVSKDDLKEVRLLWKRRGGRNLGLLLFWIEEEEKKLKVIKKLALRNPNDILIYALLIPLISHSKSELKRYLSFSRIPKLLASSSDNSL